MTSGACLTLGACLVVGACLTTGACLTLGARLVVGACLTSGVSMAWTLGRDGVATRGQVVLVLLCSASICNTQLSPRFALLRFTPCMDMHGFILVSDITGDRRRLGGESDQEISMAPACVILSLGIRSENSPGRPWGGLLPSSPQRSGVAIPFIPQRRCGHNLNPTAPVWPCP